MERGLEFPHIGETPSIEVIKDPGIFGKSVRVFMEESIGRRGDGGGNAERSGDTFAELGFASAELTLQRKNKGIFVEKIEVFMGETACDLLRFF